jgi:hypothetical protein
MPGHARRLVTATRRKSALAGWYNDYRKYSVPGGEMAGESAKTVFTVSCLLCLVAIAAGALLEIVRQTRGESLLRPWQFRLRVFSALVWMIALASLAYAVAFLWPQQHAALAIRKAQAEKFLSVISGAMILLLIGIILLAYDMWQLARERRLKEAQFNLQLVDMARTEIEKAHTEPGRKADEAP